MPDGPTRPPPQPVQARRRTGGYFTAAQAKEIGYSYQAQAHHVAAGNWLRDRPGTLPSRRVDPDLHDDLVDGRSGRRAAASCRTRQRLSVHAIGEFESARVHLTVPPGSRMRDDAVVLHRADLADADVDGAHRLPCDDADPLDHRRRRPAPDEDQLARAIEEAGRRGLLDPRRPAAHGRRPSMPSAALHIERAIQRVGRIVTYETPQALRTASSTGSRNRSTETRIGLDRLRRRVAVRAHRRSPRGGRAGAVGAQGWDGARGPPRTTTHD